MNATWDDPDVRWDDPFVSWDGAEAGQGATVVDQAALAYAILDTARFTVEKDEDPSP